MVTVTRAQAIALASEEPETLRKYVVQEGAPDFLKGILESLKPRTPCRECGQVRHERWAFRLWAEIAKLVGVPQNVQTMIVNQLGVTISEAQSVVPLAVEARDMTDEERYNLCKQYIRWYESEGPGAGQHAVHTSGGVVVEGGDG